MRHRRSSESLHDEDKDVVALGMILNLWLLSTRMGADETLRVAAITGVWNACSLTPSGGTPDMIHAYRQQTRQLP